MAGQDNVLLNDTVGCTFIGVVFALTLFGASCGQTLYYYREYPKDKVAIKCLVIALWLLDTSRTILDVAFLWYWLVMNRGNVANLTNLPETFTVEFFLAALTVFVVQCYFVHTIWRLLEGRWYRIPLSMSILSIGLVSFVGGIVSVERISLNANAAIAVVDAKIPASIQTVTAFVADAGITLSLCAILWGQKTGFKRTETLITTLMIYAIHRGIFTGLIQLAHFATFISTLHTETLYWMIWHVPGSKIYVNSLLAVLNVRHHLADAVVSGPETHFSVDVFPMETVSESPSFQTRSRGVSRATTSHTRIMFTKEIVRDDGAQVAEQARELEDVSGKASPW